MWIERVQATREEYPSKGQGEFFYGDVFEAQSRLGQYARKVDLVYIDPPFFTNAPFEYQQRIGVKGYRGNKQYRLKYENDFDRFEGGMEEYLSMLRRVLETARELLNERGSIYVHVDARTSAHVRLLCDEVFGEKNFLNEIIWHYNTGGRSKQHYSRKHDTILFYKKEKKPYFCPERVGEIRGSKKRNNMKKNVDEDGRVYYSIRSNGKIYKYYEDTVLTPADVWSDIPHLQQLDPERNGYPTQKPLALLERIVCASCPPGGLVADLFLGGGTTAEAAARQECRYIGMDKSLYALHASRKRMVTKGYAFCADLPEELVQNDGEVSLAVSREQGQIAVSLVGFTAGRDAGYKDADQDADLQLSFEEGVLSNAQSVQTEGYQEDCGLAEADFWAIGYLENGIFRARAASGRSQKQPGLLPVLQMEEQPGEPCIVVADIYQGYHTFALHSGLSDSKIVK